MTNQVNRINSQEFNIYGRYITLQLLEGKNGLVRQWQGSGEINIKIKSNYIKDLNIKYIWIPHSSVVSFPYLKSATNHRKLNMQVKEAINDEALGFVRWCLRPGLWHCRKALRPTGMLSDNSEWGSFYFCLQTHLLLSRSLSQASRFTG